MSIEMIRAIAALQAAVDEELQRQAKLGQKVVVGDKLGRPKLVSAKYLLRKQKTFHAKVGN